MCVCSLSHVRLFVTTWTAACQAPLSMEFSRQENWTGLLFLTPGHLPDPGIKSPSPALQVDSLPLCQLGSPMWVRASWVAHACSVAQLYPALCDPMDYSLPSSSVQPPGKPRMTYTLIGISHPYFI